VGTNSMGTGPNSAELAATPIVPPTFSSSASASPNPVTQGSTTAISATVTCTANTLQNGIVQVLVLDSNGSAAVTQNFTAQSFTSIDAYRRVGVVRAASPSHAPPDPATLQAYALPLVLMAVTDPFVGGYSAATPMIYAAFLINVWIGTRLRGTENPLKIGAGVACGSLVFFLLTNFAWLAGSSMYPHTLAGVMQCYIAAIPFYGRTLASDLLYSGALFGLHAWLSRMVARAERVHALQTA